MLTLNIIKQTRKQQIMESLFLTNYSGQTFLDKIKQSHGRAYQITSVCMLKSIIICFSLFPVVEMFPNFLRFNSYIKLLVAENKSEEKDKK
jgi:hypothetical protein